MDFGPPAPLRSGRDGAVPMINVVFLLLVFFLMAATLAPPDPLAVALPEGRAAGAAGGRPALSLGPDGTAAFGALRGAEAVAAAARAAAGGGLELRADAAAAPPAVARLLAALAEAGVAEVALVLREAPR